MGVKCVLVDLDGTIADCQHRRHFVDGSTGTAKNWDKFFDPKLVAQDPVIVGVQNVVLSLSRDFAIIYVTARREELRHTTMEWLRKNQFWVHPYKLVMRAKDDRRDDVLVKSDILQMLREQEYEPIIAIDDRSSVVRMWREQGLTCLQVAEGDF